MNMDPNAGLSALAALGPAGLMPMAPMPAMPSVPNPASAAPGFGAWLGRGLAELNAQLAGADHALQQLAAGQTTQLHTLMLQLEEARLAMQVASQVRTRVVEAYQDVMRMQV